jgi:hypothetical protein
LRSVSPEQPIFAAIDAIASHCEAGEASGHGRLRDLIPDETEQKAIAAIVAMRRAGRSLMAIRDTMQEAGHRISHVTVANIIQRHTAEAAAAAA